MRLARTRRKSWLKLCRLKVFDLGVRMGSQLLLEEYRDLVKRLLTLLWAELGVGHAAARLGGGHCLSFRNF